MERISKCDSWAILSSPFCIAFHEVATLEVLEFPELGMEAVWKIEADHGSMGRFESNPRAPGRPRWKTSLHLYWLMTKVLCLLCLDMFGKCTSRISILDFCFWPRRQWFFRELEHVKFLQARIKHWLHLHFCSSSSCFRPKIEMLNVSSTCRPSQPEVDARYGWWHPFVQRHHGALNTVAFGCLRLSCHLTASLWASRKSRN